MTSQSDKIFESIVAPMVDQYSLHELEAPSGGDAEAGLRRLLNLGYSHEEILVMLGYEEGENEV